MIEAQIPRHLPKRAFFLDQVFYDLSYIPHVVEYNTTPFVVKVFLFTKSFPYSCELSWKHLGNIAKNGVVIT